MGNTVRYVIKDREQSALAEAYRAMCAIIQQKQAQENMKVFLFVSACEGDGGAMTAVNAAAALCYAGKQVVILDCDMRTPVLRDGFGLHNLGLTSLIDGTVSVDDIIQQTWIPNLKVVTSGPTPVGPMSALSNEKTRELIEHLRGEADYVFITSSPLLIKENVVISDACVLASRADGVLLVVDSRAIKPRDAQKVLDLLTGAKANMIGSVLNDVVGYDEVVYHAASKRRFLR